MADSERRRAHDAAQERRQHDVVIMGGGLAGLTLALQLRQTRPHTSVAVVERGTYPVAEAAHKVGEATVEVGSLYFRDTLGLIDHLENEQILKMNLRFFPQTKPGTPLSNRLEAGPSRHVPARSHQIDRGRFENHLAEQVVAAGADLLDGAKVTGFELNSGEAQGHTVSVVRGNREIELQTHWLIDASGRRTLLKNKLGLHESVGHNVNAAWFRLGDMVWMDDLIEEQEPAPSSERIERWREALPRGERWRATNHLIGRGYWAWLIPLSSGSISIGLVADPRYVPFEDMNRFEKLLAWLEHNEPELARAVAKRRHSLQDFLTLKGLAYGSKRVFSPDRWCLTGMAGVFTDPLYSPGSDFIGFGNRMITDLVVKDLDGEDVTTLAELYNVAYLKVFEAELPVWEDQYRLMGNPQVWVAKLAWDIIGYFGILAPTMIHGKFGDPAFLEQGLPSLEGFHKLELHVQRFFRMWDDLDQGTDGEEFSDLASVGVQELNGALLEPHSTEKLTASLAKNLKRLEHVTIEIMRLAARRLNDQVDVEDIDPYVFQLPGHPDAETSQGEDASFEIDLEAMRWAEQAMQGFWPQIYAVELP